MIKDKFLENYLNSYTPTGEEYEGQKIWIDELSKYVDSTDSDAYGTAYGVVNGSSDKRVVIEAHVDEISWMVINIESDGFLRVKRNGGSDNMIAPSKTVVVRTHKGEYIRGVFGYPAVHVRKNYTEQGLDQNELWVDLGLTKEEVLTKGVEVGNMVIFDDKFSKIGNYYTGRSLDNRIGGYIILEVAKRLKENNVKLPFDLYVVNSVQEEVGLYGAKMIAQTLKPDMAIIHDVCHNTNTPRYDKSKDGDVKGGNGPVLEYTAQNHRKIVSKIREIADSNEIPYQLSIGSYGNDTMGFFLANGGTPTTIIATPLKYMHTTVEQAHVDDVENAIKLFYNYLINIDVDFINSCKKIL